MTNPRELHPDFPSLSEINWDAVRLGDLFGRAALGNADHPVWSNSAFIAALADRERARRTPDDESRGRVEAREMMLRVMSRGLGMQRPTDPQPLVPPSVRGSPSQVRDIAHAANRTPRVDLGVAAGDGRELWDEPADWWVELPKGLPKGDYLALRIVGDSMSPLMHTDDTVLVKLGGSVKADTVIVARHPEDGYVCKAVDRVTQREVILRSLAPDRKPIVLPRDKKLILGTVVLVWCEHRPALVP
ncbi:MAG: Peptidase conserved region [Gemmatimonadetes bacterium]|nr:Peptidase conserved region [Gemmatimonadota bacterium]